MIADALAAVAQILDRRGEDYSHNGDQFAAVRITAQTLDLPPWQVAHTLAAVKDGRLATLAGRPAIDPVVYDTLLDRAAYAVAALALAMEAMK